MQEKFVVHPDYAHLAEGLREALSDFSTTGNYVVQGERNDIKKITIDGVELNVKKFKTPNPFQSLVYQHFRESKARRSYEYALKLLDLDIKTPTPVAYLETFTIGGLKESFYVSLHLEYSFDFRFLIHHPRYRRRDFILKKFTQFTFKLHENGINFLDHSPGNTLIVQTGEFDFEFYLIDLNRMRFETMDFPKRMKNFRRLWLSKTMITTISKEYAKLYGTTEEETEELMTFYSREFQKAINSKKLRQKRKIERRIV